MLYEVITSSISSEPPVAKACKSLIAALKSPFAWFETNLITFSSISNPSFKAIFLKTGGMEFVWTEPTSIRVTEFLRLLNAGL